MSRINGKILCLALMVCALTLIGSSEAFCKEKNDDMLMQRIRQHIEKNMLWPVENIRIEFLSRMPSMDNLSGKITCGIESRPREEYVGDTSFSIRLFSNGIFIREESIRVRIEVLRDFIVSQKSIVKDSILSDADVTVQQKWVRSIPMNTVSSLDEALGKNITVSIRPNTQITRTMLKDVMPVKKGKIVQVILDNGVMKMMMSGIAEEDGADDALVKVRNLNSNKIIYARVIGQGKVQIDF
jgi:flagellar basal body P-ring formation protein FlgA